MYAGTHRIIIELIQVTETAYSLSAGGSIYKGPLSGHCRTGTHICRETVRLYRTPFLYSRLHTLRHLPCAATSPQHSSSGKPADDLTNQFSIRRQLQASGKITKVQVRGYKVAQLREALQEEGLSTKGLKPELVERLYELVQTLSQEDAGSKEPLKQPSTAEISEQEQHSESLPEAPEQVQVHSLASETQPELAASFHDDIKPSDSAVIPSSSSAPGIDSQPSNEVPSSLSENKEEQLTTLHAADVQQEPASQSASDVDTDLAAAAVPVRLRPQQGHSSSVRDVNAPDRVASKTGTPLTAQDNPSQPIGLPHVVPLLIGSNNLQRLCIHPQLPSQ